MHSPSTVYYDFYGVSLHGVSRHFPGLQWPQLLILTVDGVVIAFGVGVVHLLQVLFVEVLLRRDGGHARRRTGHAHRRAAETLPGRAGVNGTKNRFLLRHRRRGQK
jgi:hypothetical protein